MLHPYERYSRTASPKWIVRCSSDDDPLVRVALPASIDNLNTVLNKLNTQRPSVHDLIHPVKRFAVSEKTFLEKHLAELAIGS